MIAYWKCQRPRRIWHTVVKMGDCRTAWHVVPLFINRFWPPGRSFNTCSAEIQMESRSKVSLYKLELFRRSGAVGIYTFFAGFEPVRSELLPESTLHSPSIVHAWIATVVQNFVVHETRRCSRLLKDRNIFGNMPQITKSQLVETVSRFVEYWMHEELSIPPCLSGW